MAVVELMVAEALLLHAMPATPGAEPVDRLPVIAARPWAEARFQVAVAELMQAVELLSLVMAVEPEAAPVEQAEAELWAEAVAAGLSPEVEAEVVAPEAPRLREAAQTGEEAVVTLPLATAAADMAAEEEAQGKGRKSSSGIFDFKVPGHTARALS